MKHERFMPRPADARRIDKYAVYNSVGDCVVCPKFRHDHPRPKVFDAALRSGGTRRRRGRASATAGGYAMAGRSRRAIVMGRSYDVRANW
jgi:hypothetical protein